MADDLTSKIQQAKQAGYSDDEIVSYLSKSDARVKTAVDAKYSPSEIVSHLTSRSTTEQPSSFGGILHSLGKEGGNFLSNFWEQVDPVRGAQGLVNAAVDIANSAVHMEPRGAVKNYLESNATLAHKAKEAFDNGQYSMAAHHALAYLMNGVPGLGSTYDKAVEEGARGEVGSSLGTTLGAAANLYAMKKATDFAEGRAQASAVKQVEKESNLRPEQQAAIQAAQESGVPVPVDVATQNSYLKRVRNYSEKTLGGSLVGDAAKRKLDSSMEKWGENLSDSIHPDSMVPETAGTSARSGIENKIHGLKVEADNAYKGFREAANHPDSSATVQTGVTPADTKGLNELAQSLGAQDYNALDAKGKAIIDKVAESTGVRVKPEPVYENMQVPTDMRPIKSALMGQFKSMSKWMEPARRNASAGYQAIRSIVEGPDFIPATEAEQGLSGLKSLARGAESEDLRNISEGIGANATKLLQKQIDSAVLKYAGSDALEALQQGRATHAAKMQVAETLDKMRAEPVQLFNQATYANDAGINQLRAMASAAPEAMPKIGKAYVQQILDSATTKAKGADSMFSQWSKLGPETKKILFKDPELIQGLDNFFRANKMLAENVNASGTASVLHAAGEGALLLKNPVMGVTYELGTALITKLLYSPKSANILTKVIAPGAKNAAESAFNMSKLLNAARAAGAQIQQASNGNYTVNIPSANSASK